MKRSYYYLMKVATVGRLEESMGTIIIGIRNVDLHSDIVFDLVNYLGDQANINLSPNQKHDLKLVKNHSYMIKDGYYQHTYGFTRNGKFIFIASKPGHFFHKLHDYKITIHLSQWKNLKQVVDTFCNIFGASNTESIFDKGDVLRLDAWLDTNLTYDLLKKAIYRKGVSVSDQRKGDRKTFYLGSKKPTPALFYEKPEIPDEHLDIVSRSKK